MNMHALRNGFFLSALLTLSGCSILPEKAPSTLYRLPATTMQSAPATITQPERLGIATPEAGHLLSSNRIVVFPEGNVVNVYEGARWHEDAPDMLQAQLIAGLQQQELFGLSAPALTDKDKQDLKTAIEIGVDYLAVSFPRHAADMQEARALLGEEGKEIDLP